MALQLRDAKYFYPVLSATMLHAPQPAFVFDQFASKENDWRKGAGDTIHLNRYPYLGDAGLTLAARAVGEGSVIGISDPVSVSPEQVALVLTDYYGPYSTGAGAVAPYGITEAVANRAAVKLADTRDYTSFTNSIGGAWLKQDHDRWHDRVLCALLLQTTQIRNPAGKADGSTLITDKVTTADITAMLRTLRDGNVPPFADGNYVAVITPQVESNLLDDSDFKTAATRAGGDRIWAGEIGQYMGIRFIRSTNIPTATVNSLTASQFVVFGSEAVGYAQGMPPEIRANSNDDYQRFLYLIWKATRAYAVLNTAFAVKGRSFA
jgi:N4-gp56 family major capsid protein